MKIIQHFAQRLKVTRNALSLRLWQVRNFLNGYTSYSKIKDAPWLALVLALGLMAVGCGTRAARTERHSAASAG
jgi:hypothetical protein